MIQPVVAAIGRFRNVLLVLGAVVVGLVAPDFGSLLEPLVTPLVVFLVYSSLRGWEFDEIEPASYGFLVLLSVGLSYVLLPVGGIRIANALLDGGALVGFAIALSVPTTAGSAIIWTRFAGGDVQLSTTISIVSLLLAPLATPVVLAVLLDSQSAVPVVPIFVDLAVIVGGGLLLDAVLPASALSSRAVERGSTLAILLLIYTSIAGVGSVAVSGRTLLALVAVSVLLLGGGLALTGLCSTGLGLDRARALPLFFTSSLKNLGIALLVAISYTQHLVVVAIITYYVVQQVFGALAADAVA